jgi:dTMP kinase
VFITFEGPEGAGKSTVLKRIGDRLADEGRTVLVTREPGAGHVGAQIREILLHSEAIDSRCELFLFLADRAHHVSTMIRPALERDEIVLCDRYTDSTVVYQSYARGLDPLGIRELNAFATDGLVPDLTLLLDVDPEVGLKRLTSKDRLDAEPIMFHRRVREGFLAEAKKDSGRWRIVDASKTLDQVEFLCYAYVKELLSRREQEPLPFSGLG